MLNLITKTETQNLIISKVDKAVSETSDLILNKINYKNHLLKYKQAKLINNDKLDI
jgi:hypothetical protein